MKTRVFESDVPARVVAKGEPVYSITSSTDHPDLGDPVNPERIQKRFIGREKIKSSAGIPLRVGSETVGVMFINYRWRHTFTPDEKKIIETLASTAAIAIQNRRLLDEVLEAERQLIATPDLSELMDLIVKGAAQITHSDRAEGYYLDPLDGELVLMAQYPRSGNSLGRRVKIEEGIIGLVATKGEPEWQHRQLCVPLQDNKKRVLGVLLLEKSRAAADDPAFDHPEIRALEVLAQPAVIAMLSAERHKVLSASEKLAALGSFVSARMHWKEFDVTGINICLIDMKAIPDLGPAAKKLIDQVSEKFSAIAEEFQKLTFWVVKDTEPVNVVEVLEAALGRVKRPDNITVLDLAVPDLPFVMGNEPQLIEVFVNLIQNAVEAMPTGGILEVGGNVPETGKKNSLVLWVRDNGNGIPATEYQRIFELGVTNKTKGGHGFGLWWTRTYLQSLGGEISVECKPCEDSKPGETTFTVKLPTQAPSGPTTEANGQPDIFIDELPPERNP